MRRRQQSKAKHLNHHHFHLLFLCVINSLYNDVIDFVLAKNSGRFLLNIFKFDKMCNRDKRKVTCIFKPVIATGLTKKSYRRLGLLLWLLQ